MESEYILVIAALIFLVIFCLVAAFCCYYFCRRKCSEYRSRSIVGEQLENPNGRRISASAPDAVVVSECSPPMLPSDNRRRLSIRSNDRHSVNPSRVNPSNSVVVNIPASDRRLRVFTRREACDAAKRAREEKILTETQIQELLDHVVNAVFDPSARSTGERRDVDLDLHMFRK